MTRMAATLPRKNQRQMRPLAAAFAAPRLGNKAGGTSLLRRRRSLCSIAHSNNPCSRSQGTALTE